MCLRLAVLQLASVPAHCSASEATRFCGGWKLQVKRHHPLRLLFVIGCLGRHEMLACSSALFRAHDDLGAAVSQPCRCQACALCCEALTPMLFRTGRLGKTTKGPGRRRAFSSSACWQLDHIRILTRANRVQIQATTSGSKPMSCILDTLHQCVDDGGYR